MTFVVIFLLGFILVREIVFTVTIQKLMNKIMSKNYYDYKISQSLDLSPTSEIKPKVLESNEQDDFNSLMY